MSQKQLQKKTGENARGNLWKT